METILTLAILLVGLAVLAGVTAVQIARSYGRWTSGYGSARSGEAPPHGHGRPGPGDAPRAVAPDIASRVLVVEDDDSVRELCEQTLSDEGYEVVTAASAEEALELLSSDFNVHDPGITILELGLVVVDLNLPGASGAELAQQLVERNPDVAVMFTSGYDPSDFGVEPEEVAFLAKPFTPDHLIDAVASAGSRRGHVHQSDPDRPEGSAKRGGGDTGGAQMGVNDPRAAGGTRGQDRDEIGVAAEKVSWTGQHIDKAVLSRTTPPDVARPRGHRVVRPDFGAGLAGSSDGGAEGDTDRAALVGFGSFSVSRKRLAAVTAAAGVAILIASGGVALARGGGTTGVDTPRSDILPGVAASEVDGNDGSETDAAPEAWDLDSDGEYDDAEQTSSDTYDGGSEQTQDRGSEPGPTREPAPEPDPELEPDPQPEPAPALEPEVSSEPSPDPSPDPSPALPADPSPEASPEPDPVVAYSEPSKDDPVLVSCSAEQQASGTTTYTVEFTVQFSGGDYDVLPREPFVNNDATIEVRGATLTWDVTATHVGERGDGDTFEVSAPSELGWADPGSDDRHHTHLPPPLTVYADGCRR